MTQTEIKRTRSLNFRQRLADLFTQVQFVVFTAVVLSLLMVGYLWHRMFILVPPGFLGVMYRTVHGGTVTDRMWGEGLHVIPPWDRLYLYEVRMQQKTLSFNVLSDEGLTLGLEVVVRFRPDEDMLGFLQKDIGPDYFDRLIKPEIESHIRRTFGSRPAHELYATVHDVLQEIAQFPLIGRFEKSPQGPAARPYVHVQDLKITIIQLPKIVEEAIVEKYRQEQLMLAYKYKLERELKEADRKRTEATGIRDFNLIAGRGVDILRWRSLEVASEFASSPNAKVVVLGGGSGQGALPMILNLADSAGGAASADAAELKKLAAKEPALKDLAAKELASEPPAKAAPAPQAGPKRR